MKGFWTCGPFKEANDRLEQMVFRVEQMRVFMEGLEEHEKIEEVLETGTPDEKLLAGLMKLDIDKKLEVLIGDPEPYEEENDEVPRETILESLERLTKT